MQSIEKAILITFLWADLQLHDTHRDAILKNELKEEYFSEHYFKLIVKTINHLKEQGKPYYLEYVKETMELTGIYNETAFNDIINTNMLSHSMFLKYFIDFKTQNVKTLQSCI